MNKEKFSVVKPKDAYIPTWAENQRSGYSFVSWGTDNKFPQFLFGLYLKSSILASIINGTVDLVMGERIDYNEIARDIIGKINLEGDTLDDIIKKAITDYLIFGGYCLKINRNFKGEIVDIYWLDMQNIRLNAEGTVAYYFPKGLKFQDLKEEYPVWNGIESFPTSIYYFPGHLTRSLYPIPRYSGALASIQTSIEVSKFHLRNIKNNFGASFIINYANADFTEDEKKEIKQGIENNFTGSDNAGSFMLAFNSSKENAVTIEPLPENQFDKKFEALKQTTDNDIFRCFRALPEIFGVTNENKGFSKNEFLEAESIYYTNTCQPIQRDIKRSIEKILGIDAISFVDPDFTYVAKNS